MNTKNKPLTQKEMAALGGKKKFEKYGREHYKEMSRKAVEKMKQTRDAQYYKDLSRRGVEARKKKALERKALLEQQSSSQA